MDYSSKDILNAFIILDSWKYQVKKQVDMKKEMKEFRVNEDEMINWIDKRFDSNTKKLHTSYEIASFTKPKDMKVLQALVMITSQKIQIEIDEAMVIMTFNIIEGHV